MKLQNVTFQHCADDTFWHITFHLSTVFALCVHEMKLQNVVDSQHVFSLPEEEKKRKVYAVRRHSGSLCLKRQPGSLPECAVHAAGLYHLERDDGESRC